MRFLSQFHRFALEEFLAQKTLMVTGVSEYVDFTTKKHLGTKVECTIVEDNTPYKQKEGEHMSNRFEKITFKVTKDVDVPLNAMVEPVNATAKVYGDYKNMLSVTCEDIKLVSLPKKA
ncbi:hypothetical protein I6E50_08210 [Roseburia hominis]|uniref:hypothetical protein n=1 Tax=Roseburia hominis TaxID=301301 RepID=UPI001F31075B|nr:hypothetical protein [Roseburia hominis]